MRLAIAYDISKDKIRNRVFKVLESYGAWKQYSVFELEITKVQRLELEDKLKEKIEDEDKVRIYELCERCKDNIVELGKKSGEEAENVV